MLSKLSKPLKFSQKRVKMGSENRLHAFFVKNANQFCILGNGTTAAPVTPSGQQHIHGGRMGGGGKVLGESASLRSHDSIHHNMDTLAVPGALDEKLNYSDMRYAHGSP